MASLKKVIVLMLVALAFAGCRKEKTYCDADIVAPVATTSLSLTNLFRDTLLESNAGGQLAIDLQTQLFRLAADTLLKLPDTTFKNIYAPLSFWGSYFTYLPGQSFNFIPANEVSFDIANGVKLKEAIIHSGKL